MTFISITPSDENPVPVADVLCLAGDIGILNKRGTYEALLARESKRFKHVFVILGNHEFYGREYTSSRVAYAAECEKYPNVRLLDKHSVWLEDYKFRVLGCSLWSHVPEDSKGPVGMSLNDYAMITLKDGDKTRKLKVDDTNKWHADEVSWLKGEIAAAKEKGERVVVMTHHAPLMEGTSDPKFDGSEINCAFSTNLASMLDKPVTAWIFGHTHYSSQQTRNGVPVVSNQLGYLMYKEKSGYKADYTITCK